MIVIATKFSFFLWFWASFLWYFFETNRSSVRYLYITVIVASKNLTQNHHVFLKLKLAWQNLSYPVTCWKFSLITIIRLRSSSRSVLTFRSVVLFAFPHFGVSITCERVLWQLGFLCFSDFYNAFLQLPQVEEIKALFLIIQQ